MRVDDQTWSVHPISELLTPPHHTWCCPLLQRVLASKLMFRATVWVRVAKVYSVSSWCVDFLRKIHNLTVDEDQVLS
jgi:hypothetical protein